MSVCEAGHPPLIKTYVFIVYDLSVNILINSGINSNLYLNPG